jgi:hypothetical protein
MKALAGLDEAMVSHIDRLARELGFEVKIRRPRGRAIDLVVELAGAAFRPFAVAVGLCANPRLASVSHAAERVAAYADEIGAIPVVGLPHVGRRVREALMRRKVGFISLDGSMSVRGPDLLIEREVAARASPWRQHVSLFSDKSSLVLRYLFERPIVQLHVRDLSRELDVSPGLVSRVLERLRKDGFLVEEADAARLVERDLLLDEWKELYRRRAGRQGERRFYMHVRDIEDVFSRLADHPIAAGPRWALSFQAGASLVRPFAFFSEVHLLVSPDGWERNVSELAESLELEPARRESNVVMVEPYYRYSWDYGVRSLQGIPVASDLQIYLDLSVYPRRGAEQAEFIRARLVEHGRLDESS